MAVTCLYCSGSSWSAWFSRKPWTTGKFLNMSDPQHTFDVMYYYNKYFYCLMQGINGNDGPPGSPGIPGCNGTKVSLCYALEYHRM